MAGTTAAVEYLAELGRRSKPAANGDRRTQLLAAMQAIQSYERGLAGRLIAGLLQIPGLTFYGIREPSRLHCRTPTVAIRLQGLTPQEVASWLGERGFYVWDGNFYALNVTESLGLEESGGLVRIGLVHYNTEQEVDRLLGGRADPAEASPKPLKQRDAQKSGRLRIIEEVSPPRAKRAESRTRRDGSWTVPR